MEKQDSASLASSKSNRKFHDVDDGDIDTGYDRKYEEMITDVDVAVGNDLAPPKIKNVDDNLSPVFAPNRKVAPEEEPVDNSTAKPVPSGSSKGTRSAPKSSKEKRNLIGDDVKIANGAGLKKVMTKNDDDEQEEGHKEEGGLSKSGKELKKLLGQNAGMNESDDDSDEDSVEDNEDNLLPELAPKRKVAPEKGPFPDLPPKGTSPSSKSGTDSSEDSRRCNICLSNSPPVDPSLSCEQHAFHLKCYQSFNPILRKACPICKEVLRVCPTFGHCLYNGNVSDQVKEKFANLCASFKDNLGRVHSADEILSGLQNVSGQDRQIIIDLCGWSKDDWRKQIKSVVVGSFWDDDAASTFILDKVLVLNINHQSVIYLNSVQGEVNYLNSNAEVPMPCAEVVPMLCAEAAAAYDPMRKCDFLMNVFAYFRAAVFHLRDVVEDRERAFEMLCIMIKESQKQAHGIWI